MPNATVSAAGGAMPADRRTILRSILAAGAMGAAPIAAGAAIAAEPASGPAGPDAELFSLIETERALAARIEAAEEERSNEEDRIVEPAVPDALRVVLDGARLPAPIWGDHYREADRAQLETAAWVLDDARLQEMLSAKRSQFAIQLVRTKLRATEILEALNKYTEARTIARAGYEEADKRVRALYDNERRPIWLKIATTRATTFAGFLAKLSVCEHCYDIKEEDEGGTGDDILRSLAHDYQAMKAACTAV